MLESIGVVLRVLHIGAGVVALGCFWIPWLLRKGSRLHRRVGWVYVVAMAWVSLTALATCAVRCLDARTDNDLDAQFLALIGVLSLESVWFGIRALRAGDRHRGWDLGMATLQALAGLSALLRGASMELPLWISFGALTLLGGVAQLRRLRRPAPRGAERVLQHIAGMGATCIATVTAFLVVNIETLGLDAVAFWVWVTPGLIGGVLVRRASARWRAGCAGAAPRGAHPPVLRPSGAPLRRAEHVGE